MGKELGVAIFAVLLAAGFFLGLQVIYRAIHFGLHQLQARVQKARQRWPRLARWARWQGLVAWWERLHAPWFTVLAVFAGARVALRVYDAPSGGPVATINQILDFGMIVLLTWGALVVVLALLDLLLQLAGEAPVKRLVRAQITAIMNLLPVASAMIIFVGALVMYKRLAACEPGPSRRGGHRRPDRGHHEQQHPGQHLRQHNRHLRRSAHGRRRG